MNMHYLNSIEFELFKNYLLFYFIFMTLQFFSFLNFNLQFGVLHGM